jgi:hypothetical protein
MAAYSTEGATAHWCVHVTIMQVLEGYPWVCFSVHQARPYPTHHPRNGIALDIAASDVHLVNVSRGYLARELHVLLISESWGPVDLCLSSVLTTFLFPVAALCASTMNGPMFSRRSSLALKAHPMPTAASRLTSFCHQSTFLSGFHHSSACSRLRFQQRR